LGSSLGSLALCQSPMEVASRLLTCCQHLITCGGLEEMMSKTISSACRSEEEGRARETEGEGTRGGRARGAREGEMERGRTRQAIRNTCRKTKHKGEASARGPFNIYHLMVAAAAAGRSCARLGAELAIKAMTQTVTGVSEILL